MPAGDCVSEVTTTYTGVCVAAFVASRAGDVQPIAARAVITRKVSPVARLGLVDMVDNPVWLDQTGVIVSSPSVLCYIATEHAVARVRCLNYTKRTDIQLIYRLKGKLIFVATNQESDQPRIAVLKGKRILVTGATGFIGSQLAQRLHEQGAHVVTLERTPGKGARFAAAGIEVVRCNLLDSAQMETIIGAGVQVVMHLGAWLRGGPELLARSINVDATRSLAEVSSRFGIERFVFTSSIAVYGPHGDLDVDEDTITHVYGSYYGDSKIRAETALREITQRTGLPVVIVRPGMVYGPGSPGWTVRIARWAKKGRLPLVDGGRGTAYPIYITNLIDLLLLCATHPAAIGQTFNAVDDGPVTLAEFLGGYMQMIPSERAVRLPGWLLGAAAMIADMFLPGQGYRYLANQLRGRGQVSNRRAKDLLGWQPNVSLSEGLQHSEKWLRREGYL